MIGCLLDHDTFMLLARCRTFTVSNWRYGFAQVSHVWCDGRMVDVRSANEEAYLKKNGVCPLAGNR